MLSHRLAALGGFVQLDDAYLGGERNGGKPGRGSENKQPFAIAVSTDENLEYPTFAVIEPVRSFDNAAVLDWSRRRLATDASDGLACFRRVVDLDHAHTVLETPGGRAATQIRGARWVNVVLGNVKHAISVLPRHAASQVRAALLDRSSLSVQPPFPSALHAAATGLCHDALQTVR